MGKGDHPPGGGSEACRSEVRLMTVDAGGVARSRSASARLTSSSVIISDYNRLWQNPCSRVRPGGAVLLKPSLTMPGIRSLVTRSLNMLGLAPAGAVRVADARVQKAEARTGELKTHVAEARAEAERARDRADGLAKQLKSSQSDLVRNQDVIQELTASVEKWRARAKHTDGKAARAVQRVRAASEHLMATETKLDLLEAAINVLDRRTRIPTGAAGAAPGPEGGPSS